MNIKKNKIFQFGLISLPTLIFFLFIQLTYPHFSYSTFKGIIPAILLFSVLSELVLRHKLKSNLFSHRVIKSVWNRREIIQDAALLFFCTSLCCLMLFEKWVSINPAGHSIYDGYFTQGGYLPHSDALSYLWGMEAFNHFGSLVGPSIHRPLATLFLASIYKIVGSNLIVFFYVLAFLVSVSIYFISIVVRRSFGFAAGLLMAFFLCQYSFSFIGTVMTENAGLIFGNVALALMWTGVVKKKPVIFFAGLFAIAFAFQLRSGAFFILPCLLLFGGLFFKVNKPFINIKFLFIGCILILCASLSTTVVLRLLKSQPKAIGNYGYYLYKFETGSTSWDQVIRDHPEWNVNLDYPAGNSLTFEEKIQKINQHSIQLVKENPYPAIKSFLGLYKKVITHCVYFLYHFDYVFPKSVIIILFLLGFFILYKSENSTEKWIFYLLLLATTGIFISSPLLDESKERLYAATVAFNCAFLAIGGNMLMRIVSGNKNNTNRYFPKSIGNGNLLSLLIFFSAMVLTAIACPVIIDRVRAEDLNSDIYSDISKASEKSSLKKHFLLDIKTSPHLKIIPDNKRSYRPDEKNISIFRNNNPRGLKEKENYYLLAAVNQLNYRDQALIYFKDEDFEKHLKDKVLMDVDSIDKNGNTIYYTHTVKYLP